MNKPSNYSVSTNFKSEQIAKENKEITETSLSMMEELLEVSKESLEVLKDIAGFLETLVEGEEEDEEDITG
jgi:hypothetical protein